MATRSTKEIEEPKVEATTEKEADITSNAYWEEKVPLTLPIDTKNPDDQTVFISVNDKSFQIMRGETVMVPRCVVEVWNQSQEAEMEAFKRRAKLAKDYERDAKGRGL